jgi:uncharacterized protein involved in exopolysaccharide biosynthesis
MSPQVRGSVPDERPDTPMDPVAADEGAAKPQAAGRRPKLAEAVTIHDVIAPLARRWRLLFGLPLGLAVVAALISLLLPSVYTAQTTLTPAASSSLGGLSGSALASLAGLAGQLGVSAGGGGSLSPDFIADVLKSREVLTTTLGSEFTDPDSKTQRPLLDILGIEGKSESARISEGVRRMEKLVKTRVDHSTGIVTLMVKALDPRLAAAIANRMRDILNSFNLERRQSQSREQARFTRERLAQAEAELRQAEAAQLRFLQRNREYTGSPLLEFEHSRLRRAVDLKQEVYTSLAKGYEEARIAEVRDTPVITTIDTAVPPDRRSSPRPVLNGVIGFLIGGVLAFGLILFLEQSGRPSRTSTPDQPERRNPSNAVWRKETAASERGSAPAGF